MPRKNETLRSPVLVTPTQKVVSHLDWAHITPIHTRAQLLILYTGQIYIHYYEPEVFDDYSLLGYVFALLQRR